MFVQSYFLFCRFGWFFLRFFCFRNGLTMNVLDGISVIKSAHQKRENTKTGRETFKQQPNYTRAMNTRFYIRVWPNRSLLSKYSKSNKSELNECNLNPLLAAGLISRTKLVVRLLVNGCGFEMKALFDFHYRQAGLNRKQISRQTSDVQSMSQETPLKVNNF